jgi:hypothetical protein
MGLRKSEIEKKYSLRRAIAVSGLSASAAVHGHLSSLVFAKMLSFKSKPSFRQINNLNIALSMVFQWLLDAKQPLKTIFDNGGSIIPESGDARLYSFPKGTGPDIDRFNSTFCSKISIASMVCGRDAGGQRIEGKRDKHDQSVRIQQSRLGDRSLRPFTFPPEPGFQAAQVTVGQNEMVGGNLRSGGKEFFGHEKTSLGFISRKRDVNFADSAIPVSMIPELALSTSKGISRIAAETAAVSDNIAQIKVISANFIQAIYNEFGNKPGNESSNDVDGKLSRSKSSALNDLYPAGSSISNPGAFRAIYRRYPAEATKVKEPGVGREEVSAAIISGGANAPNESIHVAPSAQDLSRISDQVCSILERKLKIERERRGIYG